MNIKQNQIEDYISDSTQAELDGKVSTTGSEIITGLKTFDDGIIASSANILGGGIDNTVIGSIVPAVGNFTNVNGVALTNGGSATNYLQEDGNYGPISGGAVDSVNGKTGVVTLNQDEIPDGTIYKQYSDTEKTKLVGIESGAEVNDVDSVNGKTGIVVLDKSDVGLGNVDNTSDANKPVSTAQQTALDLKQDILSEGAFVNGDKTKLDGIETGAEVNTIDSDPSGVTGADQVTNVMSLTQAEYDAIGTPNASTFYIIT